MPATLKRVGRGDDVDRGARAPDPRKLLGLKSRPELVRVFEHEADLVAGLDPATADLLRRRVAVPRIWVEAGPWTPPPEEASRASFGLLVLDGLIVRSVRLGRRECPELIGAGDVLRPWESSESCLEQATSWIVLERASLAVLDERFVAVASRWPSVVNGLLSRSVQRCRTLAFHLAIAHVRHAETRLLLLLWHLADRWGRVTPGGVHIPLVLKHELLAQLVCMRRPTVSTALQRLNREGMVERRPDGTWLLRGAPPAIGHDGA